MDLFWGIKNLGGRPFTYFLRAIEPPVMSQVRSDAWGEGLPDVQPDQPKAAAPFPNHLGHVCQFSGPVAIWDNLRVAIVSSSVGGSICRPSVLAEKLVGRAMKRFGQPPQRWPSTMVWVFEGLTQQAITNDTNDSMGLSTIYCGKVGSSDWGLVKSPWFLDHNPYMTNIWLGPPETLLSIQQSSIARSVNLERLADMAQPKKRGGDLVVSVEASWDGPLWSWTGDFSG